MMKTGILGGTFDPIHFGHLLLAEQAREAAGLSRVVFMPAGTSPFKKDVEVTPGLHRYAMVRWAIADNPYFYVSEMELQRQGVSYTVETLDRCRDFYGSREEIHFILGTDAFLTIESWAEGDRLVREYPLVIGTRAGYKEEEQEALIARLKREKGARIKKALMPKVELSSTEIKTRLREGRSLRYILPEKVETYIRERGLYGAKPLNPANMASLKD